MAAYSRYQSFVGNDGSLKDVPFIPIPERSSDRYTYWNSLNSRMDIISYQFYGDPGYGWLILQANPTLPSLEYMIEDGTRLRVPFPLELAITQYEDDIKIYYKVESSE